VCYSMTSLDNPQASMMDPTIEASNPSETKSKETDCSGEFRYIKNAGTRYLFFPASLLDFNLRTLVLGRCDHHLQYLLPNRKRIAS
jgi:hypothetical protein